MNFQCATPIALAIAAMLLQVANGCNPLASKSNASKVITMTPEQFFTEPLQVRLAVAVDRGDSGAVDAAVRDGADVNARGKDGFPILYWAMARNAAAGFEALVKNGADVTAECRDPALVTDVHEQDFIIRLALSADNPEFLRAVLRHGFDPDYILNEESKETLLFLAVYRHSEPAMQLLLDAGASIDHRNCAGYTAMGSAMLIRDYQAVWFLLQGGADPLIRSDGGRDLPALFKDYGSRGVRPDQRESFEKVVNELVKRGLLTHQDITEADKPKPSVLGDGPPGITVIEHAPDSEAGRAILELDQAEREANRSDRR